jgi:hypothetical protein
VFSEVTLTRVIVNGHESPLDVTVILSELIDKLKSRLLEPAEKLQDRFKSEICMLGIDVFAQPLVYKIHVHYADSASQTYRGDATLTFVYFSVASTKSLLARVENRRKLLLKRLG